MVANPFIPDIDKYNYFLCREDDVLRMKGLLCTLVAVLIMNAARAADTFQVTEAITVTATRTETETKNLSQEVRIISRSEIDISGSTTVDQMLQTIPGVLINRSGGPGSPVSIYLRGAKPGHTVVMIDGMKINDPMSTDRSVDLSSLLLDAVQRIEIVYGPSAAIYGSDAVAGVINIITTDPSTSGGSFRMEAGSHGTTMGGFRWSGQSATLKWWMGASYLNTDGISAASARDGNTEPDGYTNRTVNGGFNWETGYGTLAVTGMRIDANGDLDNFGGPLGDNPFYTFNREETHLRADFTVNNPFQLNGISRFTIASSENDRTYVNPSEAFPPLVDSSYNGRMDIFTLHNRLQLSDMDLSFGLEHTRETGESFYESGDYVDVFEHRQVGTDSVYINAATEKFGIQWNTGLRLDDHDTFGGETTGSVGMVKFVPEHNLRIRFHAGTAFKAPSLYQLYSPYGGVELAPEESSSVEVGLEKTFMDQRMLVSLTWFSSQYNEMIDFDPDSWVYVNVAEAEIRGSEIAFQYRLDTLNWRLAYNFYHTEDKSTGMALLRRPRAAITGALDKSWDRLAFHINLTYNTRRDDLDFSTWPAARIGLDPFLLLDITLDCRITENWQVYVRGHNMTDESYEMVRGFGTPGAAWYAGFRLRLKQ